MRAKHHTYVWRERLVCALIGLVVGIWFASTVSC